MDRWRVTPHPALTDWLPRFPERGFTLDAASLSSYRRVVSLTGYC